MTTNIGPLHLENSKVINTASEIAKVLNDYLASFFTIEDTYEIQEINSTHPNFIS